MIDLSFLTEEEQEAIMKVLQRDAELKRAEEERVRLLPEKVKDDVQLRNMSGQWFYEAKSKRHRDKIHGADIIRASMRRKPAHLAEVSQSKSNKVKNSWVSNVNKEVFVPPELHGIVEHQEEEEQLKSSSSSKTITSVLDKPEERRMKAAVFSVKQRKNPFNSIASGDNLHSGESENRPATLPQLPEKEILSPSEESQPKPNLHNDDKEKQKQPSVEPTDESQKAVKRPVPKARKLIHKAPDPVSQKDLVATAAKQPERMYSIATPPRSILKRSSSSSSTDSEVRVSQVLDAQKKNGLPTATIFEGEAENSLREEAEDSTQISLEKLKQVRFSSSTRKGEPLQSPQPHHGRETGEFGLLESDEIKSGGNDAIRSDSYGNKQISSGNPLGTYSSALQINPVDGIQEDRSASNLCEINRPAFLVNETLQTKTVTPKKLETLQKTSSNILPNSNNELSVDETCENKPTQILRHESESHKNFTDEHQLSAKTEAHEVSNTNSTSLQQGKPDLVEEQDAKTTLKPDKNADELKVADESVSKVLDWFERSSGAEDGKFVSATSQGREPKEEVNFSVRTPVLRAEYSGPSMAGKTGVTEELLSEKFKQHNSISPTSLRSGDTQLTAERMKPKKKEENEEQNGKSLTELDCAGVEEKHGQEGKRQNEKPNLLEHEEHKLPAEKCESEKAIRARRRIREIREFWERGQTTPSHGEKEVRVNANASGGGALKGLGVSDKIKATAAYVPSALDDQRKNTPTNAEPSCASQASENEHENSFEFRPGHAAGKPERTFPSDEVHEYTELPKAGNLQPGVGATSASPQSKDKNEKEALKGKASACSQQKPNFQIMSLKEKINEKSKNPISDPSQFQNLRNFWDTGAKLESSIDRGDVSLPDNTSSIAYVRKSEENDEGRDNVSKQELIQQQTQMSERENPWKPDSVLCELPLGSATLKALNVTQTMSQLDRKAVISKPKKEMGLPEQEVKEGIEKSIVSSKEHCVSLQLIQPPGDKDALKTTPVDDWLGLPIEKVEKTSPLGVSLPKEGVAETVDKMALPKAELDVFKLGLKKLEKEASEVSSSLNLKESILKQSNSHLDQCKVFGRTVEQAHDACPAAQKEEIGKRTGKVDVPSTGEHESKRSLGKLFREFEAFSLQPQTADKDDNLEDPQRPQAGLQNRLRESFVSQPSEYRRVGMKTSTDTNSASQNNCSVESACREVTGQPEEINETIEKSVVPSSVSGLNSAIEKLLKEASEVPPPKPKRVDNLVVRAVEVELKGTTYKPDGELLQEISETIEKSVAPSKVSGLNSALEKLLKEASEVPPPKAKCVDNAVVRAAEVELKGRAYEPDGELLQEISETVEKSVAPSKVSGLSFALEKLLKEASEVPPPKPKRADRTVWRAAEVEVKSTTSEPDGEWLQKISATMERSAVSKAEYAAFDVNLQKLPKDVSETAASVLGDRDKEMEGKIQSSVSVHTPRRERDHPQEIQETVGKTSVSNTAKFREFRCSLEKLLREASEASCPVSRESHRQEEFGDHVFPSQKETVFMTVSQPCQAFSSCHTQMKTAIKGGAPEQNIRAAVNDLAVSETETSSLLQRNGAVNTLEKRNTAPIDLPPLEGDPNVTEIKLFKINEKGRIDESTSLDTSEKNSDFRAPLGFRRASTPLRDESSSPQPRGARLCLMSPQDDNDEEERVGSNLGSTSSDEHSDTHSGTSLTCSEELNPVLLALKRSADRKMPSKSLEDIPSATSISTVPSQPDKLFSSPEKLKGLSKSVPSFLQEESDDRETDTASESSYSLGRIKKSPSSLTNLSSSSGMASLSSVSGSLMSIYSADFGNVDVKGNIQFAIDYVEQLKELHIFICQCKDLAVADVKRQRSDPYVKTYLLPEKYKLGKRKTSVKKKTFNPVYNEILRYKIEKDLLKYQSLNISVWHNDTFGRNSFLGEVELDLGTWDWNEKSNKQINWFPLKPRTSTMTLQLENRGEMKLALLYVPHPAGGKKTVPTGEVHIWVKECHDLPLLRGNRLNSFIKCTILPDTSRKSRQKTRTVAKTINPIFNHTMVYDGFRPEDLKEACVELTVWDHNKLANHFLGGLRIGLGTGRSYGTTVDWMDSTSAETALWEKMMNSPNTWIEDTLPLRMLMVAKLTK
ncbi:synaptotagmin-like protein 2 isoform 3-T6 [Ara ararauna]